MKPWEFRSLEPDKAAELHALWQVEQEIDSYYKSEQARIIDSQ